MLRRPDPQIIWPLDRETDVWRNIHGHYHRHSSGGGQWDMRKPLPERWTIQYRNLKFSIKPTNFKHTGLFPEQAVNWNWMMHKIANANRPIKILNLFAYTGGATVACAAAGAEVCHVDAAKGMVQWAKENVHLSSLQPHSVRFIVDDVFKFVQREQRRGNRYDAIIMDPPSYGRGPGGETWKLEQRLYPFLQFCSTIISKHPLFLQVNCYTTGISPTVLHNMLSLTMKKHYGGKLCCGEVGIPITKSDMVLPCGIFSRWEA